MGFRNREDIDYFLLVFTDRYKDKVFLPEYITSKNKPVLAGGESRLKYRLQKSVFRTLIIKFLNLVKIFF